jgi:hypothetical protein
MKTTKRKERQARKIKGREKEKRIANERGKRK